MQTDVGELLEYDYIFCPLCSYRTGVAKWGDWATANAQGALAQHLCRKLHGMDRKAARELAKQQPVVKAGTLIQRSA